MLEREKGAAAVETAISLLFLVPVFFYTLFLDDLLRYKLDLQEAVTQTIWDMTVLDYNAGADVGGVANNTRLQFCDHTSAYDSFEKDYDCDDTTHHRAVGAHMCWLVPGGRQVECGMSGYTTPSSLDGFGGQWTKGGLVTCSGRKGVQNYLVPQKLFSEFDQTLMTDRKRYNQNKYNAKEGGVHDNATGGELKDVYLFPEQRIGIIVDTWALNEAISVRPDTKSGALHDRITTCFSGNPLYALHALNSAQFLLKLSSKLVLPVGDNPLTANESVDSGSPPGKVSIEPGSWYSVPWMDWNNNPNKETFNKRGKFYMGCDTEEGC